MSLRFLPVDTSRDDDHTHEILRLNAESVHYLSPLTAEDLAQVPAHGGCVQLLLHARKAVGFLITYIEGGRYASVNYQWFNARLKGFQYIDRIVIDHQARGQGIGNSCYQALAQTARQSGLHWLAAEIDILPENPASLAFHQKHGFIQAGQQSVQGGKKRVSLQLKPL